MLAVWGKEKMRQGFQRSQEQEVSALSVFCSQKDKGPEHSGWWHERPRLVYNALGTEPMALCSLGEHSSCDF